MSYQSTESDGQGQLVRSKRAAESVFSPGFRLSKLDCVVAWLFLLLIAPVSMSFDARFFSVLSELETVAAFTVPFLAFFLFCNVFRVSRPLELCWAALFIGLMVTAVWLQALSGTVSLLIALLGMVVVIAVETRRPSYHGVGWRRLNPNLPDWWAKHGPGRRRR
ncbi:MAG: hypothetical protein AAF790_05515 [Planctomycetota bacterium]